MVFQNSCSLNSTTNCGKSHSYTAACVGDTSEPKFCSVAYFRFSYANDAVRCAFVTAETRAAPKKLLTIPKLELQAAVLSARLSNVKVKDHDYKIPTCGLTVANVRITLPLLLHRVGEILDTTEPSQWNHCPGSYLTHPTMVAADFQSQPSHQRVDC